MHELGQGAFGKVNLAIEKNTGNKYAIKQVNMMRICELNKDQHVLREKNLLDSLRFRHNNIINLMSTFKDKKNLYFVFEYTPNGTLDDLIKKFKNHLPENAVKIIFAQLVSVMEFIQKEGIMHRDLKPQNIMIDHNYNCKIIDFGDARKVEESSTESKQKSN